MMDLVVASSNAGKVKELRDLLNNMPFRLHSMADFNIPDIEETGLTFIENALLKARNACHHSGLPAIADDSGLVVNALHGAPGVFSARYAGKNAADADRIQKVLAEIKKTGSDDRSASFHCVVALMLYPEDPMPVVCHGIWPGQILNVPRGNKGFGYDPIFYVEELAQSAGEMDPIEKNHISHRGRAFTKLRAEIGRIL